MEAYRGVAILGTNTNSALDTAFMRWPRDKRDTDGGRTLVSPDAASGDIHYAANEAERCQS